MAAVLVTRISFRGTKVDVTEGGAAGVFRQMLVGVRAILGARPARTLVAMCALVSFIYGTDTVLFIGVSADKLGTGADGFGYLLARLGVGGVLMASTVNRLAAQPSLAWVILAGVAGYTLPTALMVVIHSPVLAFAVQVVRGGSTLVVDVIAITALQRAVPKDQLGRVMGSFGASIIAAIITQGEQADYLYVLLEGSVEVSASPQSGGPAEPIRTMSAPDYFGEVGILRHIPWTASVTAGDGCRCALIDGQKLLEALDAASASRTMLARTASLLETTHPSAEPVAG